MTKDDIIRMAREAGFETGTALCEVVVRHSNGSWVGIDAELIEFAHLIAAAEREACAQLVEKNADVCGPNTMLCDVLRGNAAAIRARGES